MEHGVTTVGSLSPPVATADKSRQSVGPTYLVNLVSSLPVHLRASFRLSSFLILLTAAAPVTYFPTSPRACCYQRDLSRAQLLSGYPVRRLYNPRTPEKQLDADFEDDLEENGTLLIGR